MEKSNFERRQESAYCVGMFEGDMMIREELGGTFKGRCSECVCKEDATSDTGASFDCKDTCVTKNPLPPLPGQPYCDAQVNNKQYVRRVDDTIKVTGCWYCTCQKDANAQTGFNCFQICFGNFPAPTVVNNQ